MQKQIHQQHYKMIIPVYITLILVFLSTVNAWSQQKLQPVPPSADTIDSTYIQLLTSKLTYQGNSNHFDIYTASPDMMYVIKPDSTIKFNMPTGNYRIIKRPVPKPKESNCKSIYNNKNAPVY